tara:strand:- start:885 stop:1439 length:555 start_codon:yes stop_codon:yes gene_type:complete
MALTYSSMLDLQTDLIGFDLLNSLSNKNFSSDSLDVNKSSLIMFICNHCPYVIHYHDEIIRLEKDYSKKVNLVAISSNDIINYPQDSPAKMKELWETLGLSFPYLFDETQEVARKYKAECTPEFYLFDSNKKLIYRGRMDETSPGSDKKPSGKDLRTAIDNLENNRPISNDQHPSMGCNIKWKP